VLVSTETARNLGVTSVRHWLADTTDGYDRAAVSNAARDLHGRLLIVHGLQDDNVHFQNTAQLIDRLQEHRQMFDLMVYPRDRHGLRRGGDHFHWLCLDYIRENL
jgi:dipeptidyl-peptidase-4